LMKEKGEKSSYWKGIYCFLIPWRRILQMKTGKFTIGIRSSCVFFPRRNMKPLLGVSLKSEKFGGEFKNSRNVDLQVKSFYSLPENAGGADAGDIQGVYDMLSEAQ
ncbi:hypothetical protein ACJX0J_010202, partial [Zea mays]